MLGLNLGQANLDPDVEDADKGFRVGFAAGGVLSVGFNEQVGLQFEPAYSQKGLKVTATTGSGEATAKVDYIDVPALLKVKFGQGNAKPYILGGPFIGFNLSSKVSSDPGGEVDIKDETKSTDFGVNFGAGVQFPSGSKNDLFIEGQYSLGLTDIDEDDESEAKLWGIFFRAGRDSFSFRRQYR